jgi:hypothetical protein
MKFLCLAYGTEEGWLALSKEERDAVLARDEVLRQRGDYVAILGQPSTVRTPHDTPEVTNAPYACAEAPMVGFSLIEASSVEEAIELVAHTPCPVAGGAIEVRAIQP